MIPFEEIRDTKDRSWSLRLVDEIAGERLDDLDEILETLSELRDYRVEVPLTSLMLDTSRSSIVREAASDALSCTATTESDEQRREWWHSDDLLLKRHAVRNALRADADLIESIANDPEHQFHLEAIVVLGYCGIGWEEPKYQSLKIRALSHKDADVRAAAAEALIWDEPVAAESALLATILDEDDDVVEKTLRALAWYKSRRVVIALHELRENGPERLRQRCNKILQYVLEDFQFAVSLSDFKSEEARAHLTSWMAPVQSLLVSDEQETTPDPSAPEDKQEPVPVKRTREQIVAELSNADGKWSGIEYGYWKNVVLADDSEGERNKLADFMCASPDHYVRSIACEVFAKWDMGARLVKLTSDRDLGVRKAAAYRLAEVSRNEEYSKPLWELVSNPDVQGFFARESLSSYLVHAPASDNVVARLTSLVCTDEREGLRADAIYRLDQLDAREALISFLPLLFVPPSVSWGLHNALLDACVSQEIAVPNLERLFEIDSPEVQNLIARMIDDRCTL